MMTAIRVLLGLGLLSMAGISLAGRPPGFLRALNKGQLAVVASAGLLLLLGVRGSAMLIMMVALLGLPVAVFALIRGRLTRLIHNRAQGSAVLAAGLALMFVGAALAGPTSTVDDEPSQNEQNKRTPKRSASASKSEASPSPSKTAPPDPSPSPSPTPSPVPSRSSSPSLLSKPMAPSGPSVLTSRVTRVVDGDTADVTLGDGRNERVRFIGVDTPERGDPYYSEASAYTANVIAGKEIFLELDVEHRDRYGRLLAYVWLSRPASGSEPEVRRGMLNSKLLLDGYAQLLTIPPNVRYVDMFRNYQTEARNGSKGLWGLPAEDSTRPTSPPPSGNCDSAYPDVCIASPPPDLDCGEISHKDFKVIKHPDPHGFDGDNDGIGCES